VRDSLLQVGEGLITAARFLALDEISTGLDSAVTYDVRAAETRTMQHATRCACHRVRRCALRRVELCYQPHDTSDISSQPPTDGRHCLSSRPAPTGRLHLIIPSRVGD
jgi:hypothetical protein